MKTLAEAWDSIYGAETDTGGIRHHLEAAFWLGAAEAVDAVVRGEPFPSILGQLETGQPSTGAGIQLEELPVQELTLI